MIVVLIQLSLTENGQHCRLKHTYGNKEAVIKSVKELSQGHDSQLGSDCNENSTICDHDKTGDPGIGNLS